MIPDIQALEIIDEKFFIPGIVKDNKPCDLFESFDKIATYSISLMENDDRQMLRQLLYTINDLHCHCGAMIRTAIENIFIYRLSNSLDFQTNRNEILSLFPPKLADVVYKQWNASAI